MLIDLVSLSIKGACYAIYYLPGFLPLGHTCDMEPRLLKIAYFQSLEGRWLSGEWGGVRSIVEIVPCAEGLCGTIVDVRGGPAPEGLWATAFFGALSIRAMAPILKVSSNGPR